jgi:hypothetical protein
VDLRDRNPRIIAVLTDSIACSFVHRFLHNRSYHRNIHSHDDNVGRPQKVQLALKNDDRYSLHGGRSFERSRADIYAKGQQETVPNLVSFRIRSIIWRSSPVMLVLALLATQETTVSSALALAMAPPHTRTTPFSRISHRFGQFQADEIDIFEATDERALPRDIGKRGLRADCLFSPLFSDRPEIRDICPGP